MSTGENRQAKKAVLNYQVLSHSANFALLRCRLETGRKHQIRVQLKHIGHPVCGDVIYGTTEARRRAVAGGWVWGEAPHRLALHASHLGFKHPATGKMLRFDLSPPESFAQCLSHPAKPPAPVPPTPAPAPARFTPRPAFTPNAPRNALRSPSRPASASRSPARPSPASFTPRPASAARAPSRPPASPPKKSPSQMKNTKGKRGHG